jgi:hypothetical protein
VTVVNETAGRGTSLAAIRHFEMAGAGRPICHAATACSSFQSLWPIGTRKRIKMASMTAIARRAWSNTVLLRV